MQEVLEEDTTVMFYVLPSRPYCPKVIDLLGKSSSRYEDEQEVRRHEKVEDIPNGMVKLVPLTELSRQLPDESAIVVKPARIFSVDPMR